MFVSKYISFLFVNFPLAKVSVNPHGLYLEGLSHNFLFKTVELNHLFSYL